MALIFHLLFQLGVSYAGYGGSPWYVAVSIFLALALAILSWFTVEKPALSLKKKIAWHQEE